jgi:hypothetical protein
MKLVANFGISQLCWFACLIGAASGTWWLGVACVAAFLCLQLALTHDRRTDLVLVAAAIALGLVVDTGFVRAGLLEFASPVPFEGLAPAWIVAMWVNFALTLNHSLRWLQGRPWLAATFGLAGGAGAYLAGVKLGAARMTADPALVLAVIGMVWALAMPCLAGLARQVPALWVRPSPRRVAAEGRAS